MSNNFEFFEEELNAGAGWGRGQIKAWIGNLFLTPNSGWDQCQIIWNFSKRS